MLDLCMASEEISYFLQKILPEQGLLEGQENWTKILRFFGDEEFVQRLNQKWTHQTQELGSNINVTRWNEIEIEVAKLNRVSLLQIRIFEKTSI